MTAPSRRPASTLPLPFVAPRDDQAEAVILGLLAGYYGEDGHGAGLLVGRLGGWHTARCQRGLWIADGDSLRGGQPCSARCRQVAEAIQQAADWLKIHEHAAPPALGRKGV